MCRSSIQQRYFACHCTNFAPGRCRCTGRADLTKALHLSPAPAHAAPQRTPQRTSTSGSSSGSSCTSGGFACGIVRRNEGHGEQQSARRGWSWGRCDARPAVWSSRMASTGRPPP
eukprot:366418-Chlamydomonas_euryale.AAC.6